ncbi:MAG: transposase [Acidimicrobiales bacterium]|nr:transposase [Acidimicrobiales bacterium]
MECLPLRFWAKDANRELVGVNPQYTSQTCPVYRHASNEDRKTREEFPCRHCRYL